MPRLIGHRLTAYFAATLALLAQPLRLTQWVVATSIVLTVEQWAAEAAEYYSLEEALTTIFPEADDYQRDDRALTATEHAQLAEALEGKPLPGNPLIYTAKKAGTVQGYALVLDEVGKHKPITFMIGVTPEGAVQDALVMVFRETRGWEIRRKRFMKQFRDKTMPDPIDIRSDITHVTGATLSSRAATVVVRRALALQQVLFGEQGTRISIDGAS